MGKPIKKEYSPDLGILKFFPYKAAACLVSASGVQADANGKKIVKAGTPFPANDATCLGYLFKDVFMKAFLILTNLRQVVLQFLMRLPLRHLT